MNKQYLTHAETMELASDLHERISEFAGATPIKIYPVPRGGVPVAYLLSSLGDYEIVNSPEEALVIVDDIVDSGETRRRYIESYRPFAFISLVHQLTPIEEKTWIVFPWEQEESGEEGIGKNVTRILQYVGENPERPGLLETPERFTKAWEFYCSGYSQDPAAILKTFEDGAEDYDQMVSVVNIPFYSHCEHHLAPFFGTATVAYIPDQRIVGLSKLSRIVDVFARRLQVQERLTSQIAEALHTNLQPKGVGVYIKARHMCMESRGVCQQGHHTITTALRGAMKHQADTRAEFLNLTK